MKRALLFFVLVVVVACKREEDAPQSTTTTTTTASATVASTGPTQLVALTQPVDSAAPPTTPMQVAATAPIATTPPTSSGQTANARAPSVVIGAVTATGLPAETVARVARQNIGRYRQCYDAGLRGNPALRGRVMARITIDANGSIMSAEDANSDLPDQTVTSCVFGTLGTLTFPQPEGGSATATVPIVFSPTS
jgi:hypothetical protein